VLIALFLSFSVSFVMSAGPVFKVGKKTYTMEQVKKENGGEFYDIEKKSYELIERLAKNAYLDYFFQKMADKKKVSMEKARDDYLKKQIKVSEAQIKSTLDKYKNTPQLSKLPAKEQREKVKAFLEGQEARSVITNILSKAEKSKELVILYPRPKKPVHKIPLSKDDHIKGPKNAKVTVVEFSDFECPYCAKAKQQVSKVLKKYKGKVRVVFKHFPLSFHKKARLASEYACCADKQGKFWELHDKIFDNQKSIAEKDLKKYSKALKLDMGKMAKCLAANKCKEKIRKDQALGEKVGVSGTPAFFINGQSTEYGLNDAAIEAALRN